jgi:hypothetical protein
MRNGWNVKSSLTAVALTTFLSLSSGAKAQDSPIFRHSAD